jgi:hypothetical protein
MTNDKPIITIFMISAIIAVITAAPRYAEANSILIRLGRAGEVVVDFFKGSKSAVKPLGKEVLKHSGSFARQATRLFGDDAARLLAKVPRADAARMMRYAATTGDDTVRTSLMAHYRKGGNRFLDQLARVNERKILAGGLSTAMIVTAYNASKGFNTLAENSPEVFGGVMNHVANLAAFPYLVLGTGLALFILFRVVEKWRRTRSAG